MDVRSRAGAVTPCRPAIVPASGAARLEGNHVHMSKKSTAPMLVVMFCAAFISAFNENIINVGLSDIVSTLSVDTVTANWLVTGYMIVVTIVVTIVGFLLKRLRLRQVFFMGAGVFVVGSAGALLAPSFPVLLFFRLVQALGTGIFTPTMMNTVLLVSPREKIGGNLAVGACCITFGPAFAPVVSGLAVNLMGWRGVFVFPLIAMLALGAAGYFLIRNVGEQVDARFDIPSIVLSAVGLTAFVFGVSEVATNLPMAVAAMAAGLAVIVAFVIRQGRIDDPLMDLRPMRIGLFAVACLLVAITMMVTFSMSVLLPLYFEGSLGADAFVAGLLVLVPVLAQALGSLVGGNVMDSHGEWPLLTIGFAITLAGLVLASLWAGSLDVVRVVTAAVITLAGVGLSMSPSQTAGLRHLPQELNPFGVGIMSTFLQMAAAIGPSLFVGVLSSTAGAQAAAGVSAASAQAAGFSSALVIAAGFAALGMAVSIPYSLKARKVPRKSTEGKSAKKPTEESRGKGSLELSSAEE